MKLLRRFSKRHYFRQTIVYFLTCCMFFNTSLPVVLAGPEGAQVVNGQVLFQQSGYNTTITASDRSIINYSSFDIACPEIVEFIQPSSSASVLNRILSANPTNINGTLLANGRVFFVNPAGVYIGAGARINVNQLVASGLNITNSDFINGRYNFVGGNGSVINAGDILAEKVYLIGKQVANSGNISCPAGYVVMAAGDRVFLGEPGSDVVLEIEATSLPELTDLINSEPAVLNEGTVAAAGGTIVLAAAGDIYSQAISNVGSLSVSVETGDAGQINLIAQQGQIVNSGTIEASGAMGGAVLIDGAYVQLTDSSEIHADGTEAGGEVRLLADTFNIAGEITAEGTAEAHGHILIDPTIAYIDTVAAADTVLVSDIEYDLLHNTDVTVLAEETINVIAAIDTSSDDTATTTLSLNDEDNPSDDLTINLSKSITLGVNQTLTGEGTTINVLSEDASIQNGIDVAADGASINVADGTYTEDLTVDKSDLTLQSVNGRDNTTIQLVDGVGIDIGSGGSGFTLGGGSSDGFEILSGGATTFDIQLKGGPSDVEISWNTIDTTDNATMGISIGADGATGLNINNNTFIAELGDGCIWGPRLVDLTVSDNTFDGGSYAIQTSGVTSSSTSLISGNIITDFLGSGGIVISNGEETSDLTISDNTISGCSSGIYLVEYCAQGTPGAMTTVTVEDNTLSGNGTGLRIGDGANVLASNFTITGNSFTGNTTGLANQHASESVTATQNYWGDVDGPSGIGPGSGDSITEVVADSVDYSPWWGGDYIGDSHVTAWTWGTNDSIQDAIDLASTTVSDRIYITSGIYTETVNVNKQLDGLYFRGDGIVASEIGDTITLNENLNIYTENDGDLTLNAIVDGGTYSLLVDTGDGTLNLDENVTANSGITLDGGIINVGDGIGIDKVDSDGAVSITGTDTVTINAEIDPTDIVIESEDDVQLNSLQLADNTITVTAGTDGTGSVYLNSGGSLTTDNPGTSIGVTAADAIMMADGTEVDAGAGTITLSADDDIQISRLVTTNNTASAVAITTTSGAVTDAGDIGGVDIEAAGTGAVVTISASMGIGAVNPIDTEVSNLTADAGGGIYIDEVDGLTTADLHSTGGDVDLTAGGMISSSILTADAGNVDVETTAGDIDNTTVNASGTAYLDADGSINNASVTAGPTATLLAGTNISEFDVDAATVNLTATAGHIADTDGATDITATTAILNAGTSIGSLANPIDTEVSNLTADAGGGIYIDEVDDIELLDVDTSDGDIRITADGQMTATDVQAGGSGDVELTTTTSGDVIVDSITAEDDQITIDSAGSITEFADEAAVDLTAYELDLDAVTGIFGGSPIETSAELIAADTVGGNIDIDNTYGSAVTASSLTTGAGNILFSQSGGGSLTVNTATTDNGNIGIDVTAADLTAHTVTAGGTGDVELTTTTSGDVIVDDITAVGNMITITSVGSIEEYPDSAVDLTAAALVLDAAAGIGADDALETDVSSLTAHSAAGDIAIVEKDDVELQDILADSGSIYLEATDGGMTHHIAGTITAGSSTLTMVQLDQLDTKDFTFTNQADTDLMLQSTGGSVTAVDTINGGKDDNAADQWKSIQAIAKDNIELQGDGDIKIGTHAGFDVANHPFGGVVTSYEGGVSIISDNGTVRTAGESILDNVAITGYSDGTTGVGVDLPGLEDKKAAIVIMSKEDLNLGENCNLSAYGNYDPTDPTVDERQDVVFKDDGDAIDVAIYLGTQDITSDIDMGSGNVFIENLDVVTGKVGALVIDAGDTVTFTDTFENSLKPGGGSSSVKRIEAVSRKSEDLQMAINLETLPHADNPTNLADGQFVLNGGVYALRGTDDGQLLSLAKLLALTRSVPLVTPMPLEPEDKGEVEETDKEALMQWLIDELGEGNVQTYLARAYPPSLHTDLRPYKAAAKLQNFAAILKDPAGAHIAALSQVIGEVIQADVPPSPEQSAMIAQGFAEHVGDGTHYALAGQWIDALAEYTGTLNSEIGWSTDKSITFVMGKYGSGIIESGDLRTAMFVQTYLEQAFGG